MDSLVFSLKLYPKTYPFLISPPPPLHSQSSSALRFNFKASQVAAVKKQSQKIRCEFESKLNNGSLSPDMDPRFLDRVCILFLSVCWLICFCDVFALFHYGEHTKSY